MPARSCRARSSTRPRWATSTATAGPRSSSAPTRSTTPRKDGGLNAGDINTTSLAVIGQAACSATPTRACTRSTTATATLVKLVPGWPAKVGIINAELLPDVGEGITGSPVLAKLTCPSGGSGREGRRHPRRRARLHLQRRRHVLLRRSRAATTTRWRPTSSAGAGQVDHPVFPAVGLPAFGDLGGAQPAFVAPVAGLLRALDLVVPDYQVGGQDFTAAWDSATGQMRPGFPAQENDLAFLTGPGGRATSTACRARRSSRAPRRWTCRRSTRSASRSAARGRSSPATGPSRRR